MKIGIDVGGTKIEIIVLLNTGEVRFKKRIATPKQSYQILLDNLIQLIACTEAEIGQQASIGIGIPGIISPMSGLVKNSNITVLNGHDLQNDLSALLGREIKIANDANCMAVSEAIDGSASGKQVVLALILGTGAGAGLVINGKPHIGLNGLGGEWGHNPLPWQDENEQAISYSQRCYCGRQGCIEHFVSGTALCAEYFRQSNQQLQGEEIATLAKLGDSVAEQVLSTYEIRLAKAIASTINLLDPDVVVLAGGVSNIQRLYQNLPLLISEFVFGGECSTPIKAAQHGDSSGVRGAAWLWA
ncbi:fructokinase [Testudinibacter sp. TR-2022]|uniref:fructokinase n=1 Tax=Testudinibacter sp. TR-2022 TaxID=2585029 RepID=UPI001118465B|nr:fructokinase [Testudinibacter sp. TR-2022]TNH01986.1 fructokinase [Pasteurellaceae bacterium Phil31]TNH04717.1 fructokinase [Testudinibacter sp. TR-2022]TNH09938.1 fructokinase [Testudinibacter sp. TR-2022]TNH14449.1 fructokinase [Testudinibacter sp. TR-2022]TNH17052.1 fructokinase [Testudinibacter sp. TR-2022]